MPSVPMPSITPMRNLRCVVAVVAALACLPAAARGEYPASAPDPVPPPAIQESPFVAIPPPLLVGGSTTARVVAASNAYSTPGEGARVARIPTTTAWAHQEQVLLVFGSAMHKGALWLKVLLPVRPNGTKAWIPADNAVLSRTPYWVTVHEHTRRVDVYRAGTIQKSFRAVIGKRSTPTPEGLAAIYERVRQPDPKEFLGSWVLSLTSLSGVIQEFAGGSGRIGIHGRAGKSLEDPLGSARSHGCIRIDNSAVAWIAARVPQGTPVWIRG
jgi:lipoprotein-anchoring transpeptidase ErfK/SrfK